MKDEEYVFYQDVREKKVTGYSARKQRSHCGKGGRVKLPSDYLTKKELKKMSGECVSYRLNDPMTWYQFKAMPEDLQLSYIKAIQDKYDAPIGAIAKMLGISDESLIRLLRKNNFPLGKRGRRTWDKVGFAKWCYGASAEVSQVEEPAEVQDIEVPTEEGEPEVVEEETPVEEQEDNTAIQPCETEEAAAKKKEHERMLAWENRLKKAIPTTGSMTFEDKADNVLLTLSSLLGNKKVCIHFEWTVVEE